MYLLTSEILAKEAARRWRQQMGSKNGWYWNEPQIDGTTAKQKWEKLDVLQSPTPEQVDEIIGNNSWTTCLCDSCKERFNRVVVFGSNDFALCEKCLREAQGKFEGE